MKIKNPSDRQYPLGTLEKDAGLSVLSGFYASWRFDAVKSAFEGS